MNIVLTFDTFDLFHPGHEFFLGAAATHGDRLVVVVTRDENVLRIKGKNPIDTEKKRVTQVKNFLSAIAAEHLTHGYDVMLGNRDWEKRLEILYNVSPDIICVGYDQEASIPDGAWKMITLGSYHPEKFKSSLLRQNITDSTKQHEDQLLIEKAKKNKQDFSLLYEKYVDKIFQFCYYRTGQNTTLAEDLTAEVFTRSLQALPQFTWQGYPYSSYLYTVARSVCIAHYKKKATIDIDSIVVFDHAEMNQKNDPDLLFLWKKIQSFSKETQELFELRYLEDLSYDDTAQITGKSSGSIRTTISRTVKKLQKEYAQ